MSLCLSFKNDNFLFDTKHKDLINNQNQILEENDD